MASSLAIALTLVMGACEGGDLSIRTGPRGFSTGGSSTQPSALVGRWQRTVLFTDVNGQQHSSETTWEFRADGIAIRTVVTKNLSAGLSDVVVTAGRWSVSGRTLAITFTSVPGSVLVDFTVFGNVLTLNGQDFIRIS